MPRAELSWNTTLSGIPWQHNSMKRPRRRLPRHSFPAGDAYPLGRRRARLQGLRTLQGSDANRIWHRPAHGGANAGRRAAGRPRRHRRRALRRARRAAAGARTHAGGHRRRGAYITNAVKHFKWERRGKRRLHKHPEDRELAACQPWLAAEIAAVKPCIVVALGVSAAKSVLDARTLRLRDIRGAFRPSAFGPDALVTVHPSALLRLRDRTQRARAYSEFVADLRAVAARLRAPAAKTTALPRRRHAPKSAPMPRPRAARKS